jgi:DNA-binding response OmpR family regulator
MNITPIAAPSPLYNHMKRGCMQSILIIDDDDHLRDTVSILFEQEGFQVLQAADGRRGLEQALTRQPNLMVVDLRLPVLSGLEVCKQVRSAKITSPIIVLSAVGEEVDKVLLLEMGADDYIVKPFGARELLARARAVLRRVPECRNLVTFGENEVDLDRRLVRHRGKELNITPVEYKLLSYFLENVDKPLTRDMILNSVWGYEVFPNVRTVDAHVQKLRQKLEADPDIPRHFVTLVGVGYRFAP